MMDFGPPTGPDDDDRASVLFVGLCVVVMVLVIAVLAISLRGL